MKRSRMPVWTVRWSKALGKWVLKAPGRILMISNRKTWVVGWGLMAFLSLRDPGPVSVRIYLKNGRIQEERTYPRSADPRRSRG